ncbi:unnamed protein product [Sphagnum tenellum]
MDFRQGGNRHLLRRGEDASCESRSLLQHYNDSSCRIRCGLRFHGMQALFWILLILSVMYVLMQGGSSAQQAYNNASGYTCPANNSSSSSCSATILYRTQTLNEKLTHVATLFKATVKAIANLSNIKQFSGSLAFATPLYIPITCRCLNGTYQAPVSRLITNGDTFFTIANEYEGLTTVQAIQAANPNQVSTNLMIGTNITIPLRCACPAASAAQQQTDHEITNFFLTFVVFPGETLDVKWDPKNGRGVPELESEIGEMLTNNRGDTMVSSDGFQKDVVLARMSDMVGSGKPLVFSYEELQEATMNFSDGKRIPGSVFWGKVRGKLVGIKQMKGNMTESELKILTQVQHANLVKLVGICQKQHRVSGYMAPEYLEHGLVTPKADVFAFGVVLLEILSGKEAMMRLVEGVENGAEKARPLSSQIDEVLEGDNFKEKLQAWMDPLLQNAYPLDTACSVANLARNCLIAVPELRPNMKDINYALSKILVSSLKWESSVLYGTRDRTNISVVAM